MTVIGSLVSVFFHGAPEFRHRDEDDIFHPVAHIANESGEGIPELLQNGVQLPCFVTVMVPATDIGESRFNADVCFDEAGDLLQALTEIALVLSPIGGRVGSAIDR